MAKSPQKSPEEPTKKAPGRPEIPDKCIKCAMLTMKEVHALHGAEGTGERCYDPNVCRSRRSHARKADQNNYNRRLRHKQKKGPEDSVGNDRSEALITARSEVLDPPLSIPLPATVGQRYYAILLLYKEPRYRGRVHALRAQVWQGSQLVNEIAGEHCIGMTPSEVIQYVESMLAALKHVYNIPYFADMEVFTPDYCPIRPCPRHSARFMQL